jgi:hypothetical protein
MTGSEALNDDSLRKLGNTLMAGIWDELCAQPPIRDAKELTNLSLFST